MQCEEKDFLGHTAVNCQTKNNTGFSEHCTRNRVHVAVIRQTDRQTVHNNFIHAINLYY